MKKKFKMRLFGLLLVLLGGSLVIYSIVTGSSMGFWSIYIGMILVATGLSLLGINVGSYPF